MYEQASNSMAKCDLGTADSLRLLCSQHMNPANQHTLGHVILSFQILRYLSILSLSSLCYIKIS